MKIIKLTFVAAIYLLTSTATADPLSDALANTSRPQADIDRDATSKPSQVLRFFGLPDGGVVFDLFAGSGYYSEIVSNAIGTTGKVYLHNNAAYLGVAGDALQERLRDDRLQNVEYYVREVDEIDLPDDSIDLILMVLTYHDLYFKSDGWDIDPDKFFTMIHRILKPGGVLGVVDHIAVADSGSTAAQELHRIDPEFALADFKLRGFELISTTNILENADDPLDVGVFDPSIRRKTSRFVYKFVEPGS
jgi:predicted methyltransferase